MYGALLLLAVSPAGAQFFISSAPAHEVAAAQKADSACFRRADGKPVAIETVERDSTGIDTLRRIDTVDSDLIRLRDGGRDGNMILEVAGFGLTLGHTPMQRMELKKPRVWFNAFSNIELGFTQLVGVDYSGYASGEKGFLDQRLGSSFHFSFSAVQLRLALNRSRSLCLGWACSTRSTITGSPIIRSRSATTEDVSFRSRWTNPPASRKPSPPRSAFPFG
ncbi:MAG: hypothetical protein ACLRM8_09935 [Alistipes sp.]